MRRRAAAMREAVGGGATTVREGTLKIEVIYLRKIQNK